MLTFIKGTSGTPRTKYIRDKILELAEKENNKILLIVPEQFSFETEKSMLSYMGASLFNKITVTSFSFLAQNVLNKRKDKKIRLDDNGRLIFMNLVLNKLKEQLENFSTASNNNLSELFIETIKKFKTYGIDKTKLENAIKHSKNKEIRKKLQTLFKVHSEYELMISSAYADPINDLNSLCDILDEDFIFEDYTIFFDSFTAFTYDELEVIKHMSYMAKDIYVSLCTDNNTSYTEYDLFSPVKKTAKSLSQKLDCSLNEVYLEDNIRFKSNELKFLEKNIFRDNNCKYEENLEDIEIYAAQDIYDEVEFVARKIKELVINNGYNYSDFAIMTRDLSLFDGILDTCLQKHDIPYFLDAPERIDNKALMTMIISIFDIIHSSFKKDHVLTFLKTGLSKYTTKEISLLENYVFTWNINYKAWLEDFKQNPSGFTEKFTEEDRKLLDKLNKMRREIAEPIFKFKESIKELNADEITRELYEFLCDMGVPQKLQKYADELYKKGEYKLSEEQARLWQLLMDIFDQLYVSLKNKKIKSREYVQILKNIFKRENIAFTPKALDDVSIGSIDRMRPCNPKVSFVIAAVDGEFPSFKAEKNIFSNSEFNKLSEVGLDIGQNISELSANEHLLAYFALSSASEKLFVSYHSSGSKGEEKTASIIVRQLIDIFPKIKINNKSQLDYSEMIWDKATAFEILAQLKSKNSVIENTLSTVLESDNVYKKKTKRLKNIRNGTKFIFKDKNNATNLFGSSEINISASQVEKYYLCPFSYLCRYGFDARKRKKAELSSLEYGRLVHYVLEKVLKKYTVSDICKLSSSKLREEVSFVLNKYVNSYLGGYKDKAERFKFLLSKCVGSSCVLLKYIANELSISGFKPCEFELGIGKDTEELSMDLPDGSRVNIRGFVDRVDIIEKNNVNYIRIVDYKTGIKEFKLSDILQGLNMQMLIYLDALLKSSKYKNSKAAGVLYMPSTLKAITANRNVEKEKAEKLSKNRVNMNGLMFDEEDIRENINIKKNNILQNISDEHSEFNSIETILKNIENLVIEMAKNLKDGKVQVVPVKGGYDACKFCDYSFVCSYEDGDKCRDVCDMSNESTMKKMMERLKDE